MKQQSYRNLSTSTLKTVEIWPPVFDSQHDLAGRVGGEANAYPKVTPDTFVQRLFCKASLVLHGGATCIEIKNSVFE